MPFGAFMSLALYHPGLGYYASGEQRLGWKGHYITSPELDPTFGELWARGFEQVWEACGRPERFQIAEVGPGEGSFARAVLGYVSGSFADAISYVLVERVPAVAASQRDLIGTDDRVSWAGSPDELESAPFGIVFANEVLDNLPVHLVERMDGALLEICVDVGDDELRMTSRPPAGSELEDFLTKHGMTLDEKHRAEVPMSAASFVGRVANAFQRGALILIDYGMDANELASRPQGTLLCYSDRGTDDQPLERVGDKDLTVHANWTVVGNAVRAAGLRVVGPRMQRQALRALGLSELDDKLRADHQRLLDEKQGAAALRALSQRQALAALADPGGLGGLDVVVGLRGIDPPAFLQ